MRYMRVGIYRVNNDTIIDTCSSRFLLLHSSYEEACRSFLSKSPLLPLCLDNSRVDRSLATLAITYLSKRKAHHKLPLNTTTAHTTNHNKSIPKKGESRIHMADSQAGDTPTRALNSPISPSWTYQVPSTPFASGMLSDLLCLSLPLSQYLNRPLPLSFLYMPSMSPNSYLNPLRHGKLAAPRDTVLTLLHL